MGCVVSKGQAGALTAKHLDEQDPEGVAEEGGPEPVMKTAAHETEVAEDGTATRFNEALIFIKPHADTPKAKVFVEDFLAEKNIEILSEGDLTGSEIDKRGIIDEHYAHIAKVALRLAPADIPISDDKKDAFTSTFGESWEEAIEDGKLVNLKTFEEDFDEISLADIDRMWQSADLVKLKLAPGTYVGYFADQDRFVMNPFYASMRAVYTSSDARVTYYVVRFPEEQISWKDFRTKVIGATDPTKAAPGSLRAAMCTEYKSLDLGKVPNVSENGVHASAGPFEGLKERMVWTGAKVETDAFGKSLLEAGVKRSVLDSWLNNEIVDINGETDHAFDLLEEIDSSTGIQLAVQASKAAKL
ncbi:Hypothetical Protein FCC1311_081872 [Hondaea fermentalgiana]|uniref:Nucleoside-diphosphate kinase n=1 Tax=Hondaea fermentalgiana TaxID=2315210 RepID=A0A2R5GM39_9STRA|nr:Hypothetical Protein FCC1311_081872 [Hondaea fermentalgiana]|eukprot:GBG31962.1 Hypothetical Protein FCC1311_081872 [Hondaea fermentalgiana]